mgnify:CR=1 FL=1
MLSEEDGHKVAEISDFRRLRAQTCELNLRSLRQLLYQDDTFETVRVSSGRMIIVYVSGGNIILPKCFQINEVELVVKFDKCHRDLMVSVKYPNNKKGIAYLTSSGILRATTVERPCGEVRYVFVPGTNKWIGHNGTSVWWEKRGKTVKVEDLGEVGPRLNFPHFNEVIEEIDIFREIHWKEAKATTISEQVEKTWTIGDGKVNFTGSKFVDWVKSILFDWKIALVLTVGVVVVISVAIWCCMQRFKIYKREQVVKRLGLKISKEETKHHEEELRTIS